MAFNLLYRLNQKLKYHLSHDPFEKRVAEINRYEPIVSYDHKTFRIKGIDSFFDRAKHFFLTMRLDLVEALLHLGEFQTIEDDIFYFVNDLKLRITTAEEIFIVYEIFYEQCYRVIAPWKYNVIDIGMNVGFASLFFAKQPHVNKVFSFEPFKPTFDDAMFNLNANKTVSSKIFPYNFGLSKKATNLNLFFSSDTKGKNSIVSNSSSGSEQTIEIRNASKELSAIIKQEAIPFFIKMDCEGAEFEIFQDFELNGIPSEVFAFIIEWHKHDPAPIIKVLHDNNFVIQQSGTLEIGLLTAFRNAPNH